MLNCAAFDDLVNTSAAGVNGILFSEALAAEGAVVFAKACEVCARVKINL